MFLTFDPIQKIDVKPYFKFEIMEATNQFEFTF